jgi:hypothetical protein
MNDPETQRKKMADLYCTLEALRPYLEREGTIEYREEPGREPGYRLRYRVEDVDGVRRQKAIQLGDEATAEEAQKVLDRYRAEKRRQEQFKTQADEEAAIERNMLRNVRRAVLCKAGSNPARRKQVAKEFDEAAKDPKRLYNYLQLTLMGANEPRRGRPRKSEQRGELPMGHTSEPTGANFQDFAKDPVDRYLDYKQRERDGLPPREAATNLTASELVRRAFP